MEPNAINLSTYVERVFDDVCDLLGRDVDGATQLAVDQLSSRGGGQTVRVELVGEPRRTSGRVRRFRLGWEANGEGPWSKGYADLTVLAVRTGGSPVTELSLRVWEAEGGVVDPSSRPVRYLRSVLETLSDDIERTLALAS